MAYNNSKKPVSEHVYADTVVWQCSQCSTWSRAEFVMLGEGEQAPLCPLCQSAMVQETKNIRIE